MHALIVIPNVTLTPHTAGASPATGRIAGMIAEEVRRLRAGEPLLNLIV